MKNKKEYLVSILVSLAMVDGEFHDMEKKVIRRIAKSNDIPDDVLEKLIKNPMPLPDIKTLSYDERFEILYNVLVLMKADESVMDKEVEFVQNVAHQIGFKQAAFMELYPHVHVNFVAPHELRMLKKKVRNYLLSDTEQNP